jgi:hypothetical protein
MLLEPGIRQRESLLNSERFIVLGASARADDPTTNRCLGGNPLESFLLRFVPRQVAAVESVTINQIFPFNNQLAPRRFR